MMQNYIPALPELPGIAGAEVHEISRGGCVMANDAILIIGGTPDLDCRDLRDAVLALPGRFDLVVWTSETARRLRPASVVARCARRWACPCLPRRPGRHGGPA